MNTPFILLNPFAKAGKALEMWQGIKAKVGHHTVIRTDDEWEVQLAAAMTNGSKVFIAAGGDGTVNHLLNAIIAHKNHRPLDSFYLGAVGLGSSNDFHKPCINKTDAVPIKIDQQNTRLRDVVSATFIDNNDITHTRYFIVSSSIGVVAEANWFFNSNHAVLALLKRYHTSSAILYAASRTLFRYQPFNIHMQIAQQSICTKITSLNILKTNYISGCFHLDVPVAPNNGRFTVAVMENMNLFQRFNALLDLSKGRFTDKPGRACYATDHLHIQAEQPFALEIDGEVVLAKQVQFAVYHQRINECL